MTATHTINGTPAVQDGKRFRFLDGRLMPPKLWEGAVPLIREARVPLRWDHLLLALKAQKQRGGQAGDEWGNSAVALPDGRVRLSIHSIRNGDTKYLIRIPEQIELDVEVMED